MGPVWIWSTRKANINQKCENAQAAIVFLCAELKDQYRWMWADLNPLAKYNPLRFSDELPLDQLVYHLKGHDQQRPVWIWTSVSITRKAKINQEFENPQAAIAFL